VARGARRAHLFGTVGNDYLSKRCEKKKKSATLIRFDGESETVMAEAGFFGGRKWGTWRGNGKKNILRQITRGKKSREKNPGRGRKKG